MQNSAFKAKAEFCLPDKPIYFRFSGFYLTGARICVGARDAPKKWVRGRGTRLALGG